MGQLIIKAALKINDSITILLHSPCSNHVYESSYDSSSSGSGMLQAWRILAMQSV